MNGEPEPKRLDQTTQRLRQLHKIVGQIIALQSATKANKIIILEDVELIFPDDLKLTIAARIVTKLNTAARLIQEVQGDG